MTRSSTGPFDAPALPLQVYLLGELDFATTLALQRRLRRDVSERRCGAALLLCEHPAAISVGRLGSYAHLHGDLNDPRTPRYPIHWVPRGGGCILHLPGQLAFYAVLPLARLGLDVGTYLDRLGQACLAVISDFSLRAPARADSAGVWVGDRPIAVLGVSVCDWVSGFGAYLNIQPTLDDFRLVQTFAPSRAPMTSLQSERRGPVRPAMVRQRLVEHFQTCFDFTRVALFTEHPALSAHGPPPPGIIAATRSFADRL
jgi:lipoyl(octanoyl) transferase